MRSDSSVARVRPPVMTNGRTKSCAVALGGSSSLMLRLSLEHAFLQLGDERRTERRTDALDEQRHLIADRADVATPLRDDAERAAVGDRRHEEVALLHGDDDLFELTERKA